MDKTFENEQVRHLDMAASLRHPKLGDIRVMGQAIRFSRSDPGEYAHAPSHGEHNATVYGTLGLSAGDIDALKEEGVI